MQFWPTQFAEQCLGWSWYLANDTQFYFVSPIILWAYYKNRKLGWALLILLIAASLGLTTWLMFYFGIADANPIDTFAPAYMDNIYGKPYCRIAPFLIGVATAWWYGARDKSRPMSALTRWILYGVAFIAMYCPLFLVNVHYPWTDAEGILYSTAGRLSWPIGVAILMYTCFVVPDSFLNRIFAANIWGPFARLTFAAYLSHPIILFTYYLNRDHLLIYTDSDLVFWWLGAIFASYMTAFAIGMLVEKPALNLEKMLLAGGHGKRKPHSHSTPVEAPAGERETNKQATAAADRV